MTRTSAANKKRLLQLDDMWRMIFVASPTVSPDGRRVVFVQYTTDRSTGNFLSRLWEVATDGGAPREISAGSGNQSCPAFSPDGRALAFLSDQTGAKQLWLIDDLAAPTPRQLTTLRHGVDSFAWSPDGARLAFIAPIFPDESPAQIQREMTAAERREFDWRRENMPVVVEKLMYKFDETFGVTDGSVQQLGVISASGGKAILLTQDAMCHDAPAWSPDGAQIAFYGYPYGHHKATRKECFVIPAADGQARQLTTDSVYIGGSPMVFAPDGGSLLYTGLKAGEEEGFILKLFRLSIADGSTVSLMPDQETCHGVDPLWVGKSAYGPANPAFQPGDGGSAIYFTSGWQGATHIYRLSLDGAPTIEQVTQGSIGARSFCAPVKDRLIYTRSDLMSMDDLYCLDLRTGDEQRLTRCNPWLDEVDLREPVEMWVDSRDGASRIHGYVVPPAQSAEGERCPAALDIHGGPEVYYTPGFWFEFHMLSAAGMAVIYCDPRGSTGYGREFAKSEHAWGDASYDDLMAFVDAAIEKLPCIDPERLGVTGGSYGGLMVNRIIARTDRFKAAVNQRTFANQATSYGTGDMGFVSSAAEKPRSFADYMFERARKSAVTKIDAMKTPLLLLHGELDYRCTMEQSEQIFVALKDRHPEVPVRMVIFPGENHNLTRTGNMRSQMAHLREMTDWFAQHLGERENTKDA